MTLPPALANLPIVQHLPKMSLHDASSVDQPVPPPERLKLFELSPKLSRKLIDHALNTGIPAEDLIEMIFAEPLDLPGPRT